MDRVLDCQFHRRFGVEIELNTLNGVVKKLDEDKGESAYGSDLVASLIHEATRKPVEIHGWHRTDNNGGWIVKPDSSCGIEVCTPVLKGWTGLKSLMKVVEAFAKSNADASKKHRINSDNRCSMHVHVNIADLTKEQLATVIAYYIKCEHVIFDSLPIRRKNNRYCQFIGMTDLFSHDFNMDPDDLISRVSGVKYYSLNAYHFMKGGGFTWRNNRRQTIEFRIAENDACLSPFFVKNWVRFLLHFVEVTKNAPYPTKYVAGDPWSSLLFLDTKDVFKVLKFDQPMSEGLKQMRNWFMGRVLSNGCPIRPSSTPLPAFFSSKGRERERAEFIKLCNEMKPEGLDFVSSQDLYGKKYVI